MILLQKRFRITLLLLLLTIPIVSYAQFSSNVEGTVTDPEGAVVSGATVTLHNNVTAIEYTYVTSGNGIYRFNSVLPGEYRITAQAKGFAKSVVLAAVQSEQTKAVNIMMTIAQTGEQVTVNSVASDINLEETRIETTIGAKEAVNLPVPDRNTYMLQELTPGTAGYVDANNNGGYNSNIFQNEQQSNIYASGLNWSSNLYIYDDLPVMSPGAKGNGTLAPNPDMIQEVSLQTQTFSVEYGESAGMQMAYTTKSGNNQFHGSADYLYTGNSLTATPDFSPTLLPFQRSYFTGSFGGPIIKDRTFFFGSTQIFRSTASTSSVDSYISNQVGAWALANPLLSGYGGPKALGLGPITKASGGTPVLASDVYPASCGTPSTYNLPCNMPIYYNNGIDTAKDSYNGIQWSIRLDQYFRGGNDRLNAEYVNLTQTYPFDSDREFYEGSTPTQNNYVAGSYTHIFSSQLTNDAHFGHMNEWYGSLQNNPLSLSTPVSPSFNIQSQTLGGLYANIQTTYAGNQIFKEHTNEFRDNINWQRGSHTLKFGVNFSNRSEQANTASMNDRPMQPTYADLISFLTDNSTGFGLTISGTGTLVPIIQSGQVSWYGAYLQDHWKIRENLTFDAGIRWDDFGNPTSYGKGALPLAVPTLGSGANELARILDVHSVVQSHAFSSSQNPNFMPRAGIAWSPGFGANKLVIHSGIGLFENSLAPYPVTSILAGQTPNTLGINPSPTSPDPEQAYLAAHVPFGNYTTAAAPFGYDYPTFTSYGTDSYGRLCSSPGCSSFYLSNIQGYARNVGIEKVLVSNLAVEYQAPAHLVFSAAYASSHLWGGYDTDNQNNFGYGFASQVGAQSDDFNVLPGDLVINHGVRMRRTSAWGAIVYNLNRLESNYGGVILTARQNFRNLTWQASYTQSRALTNSFLEASSPHQYYGPTYFDTPRVFTSSAIYEVPKVSSSRLINAAAGGWKTSLIVTAQDGTPFTVANSYSNNDCFQNVSVSPCGAQPFPSDFVGGQYSADGRNYDYPDVVTAHRGGFSRSLAKTGVFKPGDFTYPANYWISPHEGNEGYNDFRNPGYFVADLGLGKSFFVPWFSGQSAKLTFRGTASNVLNRSNLGTLGNDLNNASTFGKATSANFSRFIEIGSRFEF